MAPGLFGPGLFGTNVDYSAPGLFGTWIMLHLDHAASGLGVSLFVSGLGDLHFHCWKEIKLSDVNHVLVCVILCT